MSIDKHYYRNSEINILWQPGLCIHSGICFKGLPEVFDPRRKPWIIAGNAETQTMIDQVKKCPSGALSFTYLADEEK
ncbi:MAG TPA: (4Fe-4S)-binding protein [Bacteroidia bacterium]|nr:(4Fe-4S)-binding protein [Bacteroidia bacterium]HPH85184.1 (4Fe-4S)-binding protein [Ferruginibacter sp.]